MKSYPRLALLPFLAATLMGGSPPESVARTYHVQQAVTLSGIPAGSRTVKWWIAVPSDDRFQDILDFSVSVPGTWRFVKEPDHGNRFLYAEVAAPSDTSLTANVEFTVRRRSSFVDVHPDKVGALSETDRKRLSDELRPDSPHMEVTPRIVQLANQTCGAETNLAVEAKLMLNAVADSSVHYSRDPSKPKFSVGDADSCLNNGGGTCTDIHSLFIAMARSRGIPARLQMGYRVREANEGKKTDPGYRCWVEYFLPGYGWIPTDIVEASDPKGLGRDRWFSGLTERRIWLNEGREFDLEGRSAAHRVNIMSIGYAEIDGVEARVLPADGKPAQLSRTVFYTEVPSSPAAALAVAK
jgi:transglutaminase-like putative cysteine protease